jgi:hypothetical protein
VWTSQQRGEGFNEAKPNHAGAESSAAHASRFTVDEDCEKLSSNKAVKFHDVMAETLRVTKGARRIAFSTTRA